MADPNSIASRLSTLNQALKKAFSPEAKYPHVPGNIEPETSSDLLAAIKEFGLEEYETLCSFLTAAAHGVIDDSELLLERLIQLLTKLPSTSKERKQLTDSLLTQLWNALDHPPQNSLAEGFKYRAADGYGNNVNHPQLGAAGTAYARTVPPMTLQNPNQPDPASIFDSLMARGDSFEQHPQGISSMLFYLATIIIHDIFQTSSSDYNINLTSSYLDLAPLYGRNQQEQDTMRTFKDGLIKPDCFSSKRILGFPPGCGVLLIMFNRFHNYVVTQLAKINENGRFNKPNSKLTGDALAAAWKKYDNDLFQTGRLITCGLYGNIILKDYVSTILALNRYDTTWNLDPRSKAGKNAFSQPSPQGVGNQVSAEFNLIYRWHSTVSKRDEQWTIDEFKRLLDGKDPAEAELHEVLRALAKFEAGMSDEPEKRRFAGLTRRPDGTLDDDGLVKILTDSIEDVAGSFGANKVPKSLKSIEVLGIMQARYWNVATLNEFRAFMGLSKHKTFEDINPDPVVAKKLQDFYGSPDAVELYPGLVAEKPKPPMTPGSGLCVNYTTSHAILSDAVALIRGDRFYTVDYTPKNITNWGYNEANSDMSVDQGHVLHKLILRAFPNHFPRNSIYAHFQLFVTKEKKKIHDNLGSSEKYSWDKPKRNGELIFIRSHQTGIKVLSNKKDFKVTWGESVRHATPQDYKSSSNNFCLSGDGEANATNRAQINQSLYTPKHWADELRSFCEVKTGQLLKKYSIPLLEKGKVIHEVDIVRDVINLAITHVMSAMLSLPLKTSSNPHGIYSEQEMFNILLINFSNVFFDTDIANSFKLREAAKGFAEQLGTLILAKAKAGKLVELAGKLDQVIHSNSVAPEPSLPSLGTHVIEHIIDHSNSVEEAVWGTIVPLAASGVAAQKLLSQCLDYYLGAGEKHLPELYRLANLNTKEADDTLMKYMLEGSRLRGSVALYRDVATDQTITDHVPCKPNLSVPGFLEPLPVEVPEPKTLTLKAGTRVLIDLTTASHDPAAFPDPEAVKLDRPLESYVHYGWGPHQCLGKDNSRVVMTSIFKAIVGLKGLRRVAGPRGELKSFPAAVWNGQVGRDGERQWTGLRAYMTPDEKAYSPAPTTMRVKYEV